MSLKANVVKALNAIKEGERSKEVLAQALKSISLEIKTKDYTKVRAKLLPIIGGVYSVPVVDGKLDNEAKNYETARKRLQRLSTALSAPKSSARVEVDSAVVDKVVGVVIKSGMTKAMFDALIAQVRESVTFV